MIKNPLIEALRLNDTKHNYFSGDANVISYKTGFPILDYYLGYNVNVYNEENTIIDTYPCIGITGGCYVCSIGKPSTGKTTMTVQMCAKIVRPFESGTVIHFDLEKSMNYSRLQVLTKFKMQEMKAGKYILNQDITSIQDIKAAIMKIYFEKKSNPDLYMYDTGKKNEFGEPMRFFVPTCVIIDSIPQLSSYVNENDKKEVAKLEEISSQTERMRLTAEIGRFYGELLPYIREANITVFSINQIKTNPNMGIVKSPSEILYLKQDEALPGGRAPQFLAHILLKYIAIGSEKSNQEDDGFDGFGIRIEIIKSRTNQAGQSLNLVYDKIRGVDNLRSCVEYARDLGLVGGNKNGYYFTDHKDMKFTKKNMHEDFRNNKELYRIMYDEIIPILKSRLSSITPEEMDVDEEEFDY